MARFLIFTIVCLIAFAAPFFGTRQTIVTPSNNAARAFPATFEDLPLTEIGLTAVEERFAVDFPGTMGRFTDGRREIIFRSINEATRRLHPASDCFAAVGYKIKFLPMKIDAQNNRWACFAATKSGANLRVCERIYNLDTGENFTDVSAWYWSALNVERGAWLAVTTAENQAQ